MDDAFQNVYEDERRALSYAGLEFPGTYWLAFRDLPEILRRHGRVGSALDFGCGAGRSTRFLGSLGFRVLGVDISRAMLARAQERDPQGEYLLVADGDLSPLKDRRFDLVFSAFTFDNIPDHERRVRLFGALGDLLAAEGRMVNLVSAPEIYVHEWLSFSTRDFPENRAAGPGDRVRIVMLDVEDRRPVEDVLWTDADYDATFTTAGLTLLETHRPLGLESDPFSWVSERRVSPWIVHVLGRGAHGG